VVTKGRLHAGAVTGLAGRFRGRRLERKELRKSGSGSGGMPEPVTGKFCLEGPEEQISRNAEVLGINPGRRGNGRLHARANDAAKSAWWPFLKTHRLRPGTQRVLRESAMETGRKQCWETSRDTSMGERRAKLRETSSGTSNTLPNYAQQSWIRRGKEYSDLERGYERTV